MVRDRNTGASPPLGSPVVVQLSLCCLCEECEDVIKPIHRACLCLKPHPQLAFTIPNIYCVPSFNMKIVVQCCDRAYV